MVEEQLAEFAEKRKAFSKTDEASVNGDGSNAGSGQAATERERMMSADQTNRPTDDETAERIVVALDASPNSVVALRAAAELASWLGLELEGLFVEDINVTRLSGLPYQQEVGSYTGALRRLDDLALQRQLRALATTIQRSMAREAGRRPVRWSFQVRRGSSYRSYCRRRSRRHGESWSG